MANIDNMPILYSKVATKTLKAFTFDLMHCSDLSQSRHVNKSLSILQDGVRSFRIGRFTLGIKVHLKCTSKSSRLEAFFGKTA